MYYLAAMISLWHMMIEPLSKLKNCIPTQSPVHDELPQPSSTSSNLHGGIKNKMVEAKSAQNMKIIILNQTTDQRLG